MYSEHYVQLYSSTKFNFGKLEYSTWYLLDVQCTELQYLVPGTTGSNWLLYIEVNRKMSIAMAQLIFKIAMKSS